MKTLMNAFSILLAFASQMFAQGLELPGGRGLLHLSSAWNLEKGGLTLHGYSSSFFQNGKRSGSDAKLTYWQVQGALTLHFASSKHLEWILTQLVYQDSHKGLNQNDANFPDDLFFKLKVGGLGGNASRFRFGFTVAARIPIAEEHNLILEPYASNHFETGVTAQMSYSPDLLIPENAFNFHLNLGFWHHNDTGDFLVSQPPEDNIFVKKPSIKFLYGIGLAVPSKFFDAFVELSGQAFLDRPPVTAYGREDFIYLSPGIKYKAAGWLSFLFGADIRLSDFEDTTLYERDGTTLSRISDALSNYPLWRVRFGTQFTIRQGTRLRSSSTDLIRLDSDGGLKENILRHEELIKQRLRTETAETELTNLREQRDKMQAVIERLKKIIYLEEHEKKKEEEAEALTEKKP